MHFTNQHVSGSTLPRAGYDNQQLSNYDASGKDDVAETQKGLRAALQSSRSLLSSSLVEGGLQKLTLLDASVNAGLH